MSPMPWPSCTTNVRAPNQTTAETPVGQAPALSTITAERDAIADARKVMPMMYSKDHRHRAQKIRWPMSVKAAFDPDACACAGVTLRALPGVRRVSVSNRCRRFRVSCGLYFE